ncbi:MAG TPA: polysaccharide lyase family protein [Candidatus Paceibacterota bacterium]|nr:polysaccharide lyase family protein [Candidatus Paceibacterota bacterium]
MTPLIRRILTGGSHPLHPGRRRPGRPLRGLVWAGLALTLTLAAAVKAAENEPAVLWQIGQPDGDNREFALAPNRYGDFREDGFFVVGKSDSKQDWPYAHPGPADAWAGGRQHTFSIFFGLKTVPATGPCRLQLKLLDTHRTAPPRLQVSINGHLSHYQPEGGAGDHTIHGKAREGVARVHTLAFDPGWLKTGVNEIAITTLSGSWALYDCIRFEAPSGTQLEEASGTLLGTVRTPPVLTETEGQYRQPVQFAVRHFGRETAAVARLTGAEPRQLRIRPNAAHEIELAVPAVSRETEAELVLEVEGRTLASRKVKLKPVRKWVVYLLPHSHVDIGYTHVQTDVEKAQWKYLEMAMEAARKSAAYPPGSRFKWNVEVLWAVDSYLQQASPEKRRAFFDAVKSGQVGLDALYGSMLTGLCRPEEFLRLLRLATELTERTGVPIESAMITDVPGYTWGVVPAFAHSGVKYFSIGPNGGDRIGHTAAAWGDKPFWWIGPNGRDKVLVWMTGTGYYQVFQSEAKLLNYLQQLEDRGYAYDYVQVRHCLGDNGAPDVNFAEKVKAWNDQRAFPKLVIATTAAMFRDFEARYGDKLPSARGDFTPYWEDGAASSARETALNRAAAERLVQAETLFALFNRRAYPLGDFYTAWRNVVLYDEHTWGAHNSISEPDHPFVKSQWSIKQANALEADRQSRELLVAANSSRGPGAPTPEDTPADVIDVVNTTGFELPWALAVVPAEWSGGGDAVSPNPKREAEKLVSQRLTSGELVFRSSLSPFTTARFYVTRGAPAKAPNDFPAARVQGLTLSAPRSSLAPAITLRVDEKTGAIASLVYGGRELVNGQAPTALNDYFYLPGSDLKNLQRNGAVRISAKETGPLIASLLVESEAPGCRRLTREIRLHALRNYVEVINRLDKTPVRAKEGVHFGFGFDVPGGVVRMDIPWAVVRPEADQLPGACKNWFTVQRWVDISNEDFGVTWVTPDAPLVQIGAITANLIGSLPDTRHWLDHLEPSPTLYSWAMNNHWHTNYRAEQEGETLFRYFIFPHQSPFSEPDATRLGLECGQPLVVLPARGNLPQAPVRVSNPNVMVSALKPADDGKGLVLRLFGLSNKPEKVTLAWSEPKPAKVFLSDNSERPRQPGGDSVEVPAHSLLTLRAEWEN